uniref:Retrovirus-related Pol polyprotein from transposon RE2 n=1 Tax=Cannabis sativa TaxID=3483 RepID=A0A803P9L6_CANSA
MFNRSTSTANESPANIDNNTYRVPQTRAPQPPPPPPHHPPNWAGCPIDKKSTSGYNRFLGGNLISWCSKKQDVVSRSNTESEYRGLALATSEVIWLQSLLDEISVKVFQIPILWCDSMGAGSLTSNPVFHARTKHVEVDLHFIRDRVLADKLDVRFVDSTNQVADIFTKPLPTSSFTYFRSKLTLGVHSCNLRGDIGILEDDCNDIETDRISLVLMLFRSMTFVIGFFFMPLVMGLVLLFAVEVLFNLSELGCSILCHASSCRNVPDWNFS